MLNKAKSKISNLMILAIILSALQTFSAFSAAREITSNQQDTVAIGLIQTGRRYEEVEKLLITLGYNVSLLPPTSGMSTFQQYDVIYLPPGWASLGSGNKYEIEAKASDYKNYVQQGGGLLMECPSYYSSFTPKILPYSVTINEKRNYYDWPPIIENMNHDITSQINNFELPAPCNQITNFAVEYENLAKGKITQSPSLLVASHGSGKILIHTGNADFKSSGDARISYRVYRRMIGWLTNFIPKDSDYGFTFFQTINTTEEVVSVDVNKDYLFVGMKKKISILQVLPQVSEISSLTLSKPLKFLKVFGDYILVADSSNISFLNISDPYHPNLTSSLYLESKTPESIFIYDEIGYIFASRPPFTSENYIYCVSLANPEAITLIKTIRCNQIPSFPNQKSGLYFSTPHLYFASANSSGPNFEIYDMANLIAPQKVSELDVDAQIPGTSLNDMNDISLQNEIGFILGQLGLVSLNLADANQPSVISHIPLTSYGIDLALSGNFAFITTAYYATSSLSNFGLFMIDVSSPDSMRIKDYISLPAYPAEVVLKDSLLFVANGNAGISILNVNLGDVFPPKIDPGVITVRPADSTGATKVIGKTSSIYDWSPPVNVEVINTATNEKTTKAVEPNGSFIVNFNASQGNGLSFTATDSYNPKNISSTILLPNVPFANIIPWTDLWLPGYAKDIGISGDVCYLAMAQEGLSIIDISNPEAPGLISNLQLNSDVENIKVKGKYIFSACNEAGVKVVNIENSSSPFIMAERSVSGAAKGIDVRCDIIFATVSRIIPNSHIYERLITYRFDGSSLIKLDSLTYFDSFLSGNPKPYESSICVYNTFAYICDELADFVIIDISNPEDLKKITTIDISAYPGKSRLHIQDKKAFLMGDDIDVYDLSNLTNPSLLTKWRFPGISQDLFISENLAVVSETRGVGIFEISNIISPLLIDYIGTPGDANKIMIRDSLLYLADGAAGLTILNAQTLALDINQPPPPFDLLTPLNGDTIYSLSTNLNWEESIDPDPGDVVSYVLYYSDNHEFLNADSITNIQANSYHLSNLQDHRNYFWRIKAMDTHGAATKSNQVFSFFTFAAPLPFKLISPASGDSVKTNLVSLTWRAAFDPNPVDSIWYSLYLDTTKAFIKPISIPNTLDTTYIFSASLKNNTLYYWTVLAKDKGHFTTASLDTFNFFVKYGTTNQPPGLFTLDSPANGNKVTKENLKFSWHPAIDPDPGDTVYYNLFYATDSLFSNPVTRDSLSDTTYTLNNLLRDKTKYYWTVEAFDKHNAITRCSDIFSFWVDYTAVNIMDAQLTPKDYFLDQNYPNPFNPQTTVTYGLPEPSNVAISIFDLHGRLVVKLFTGRKKAGYYVIAWNASEYPSGTYFIKMQADNFVQVKKCVLLK